MLVFKVSTMRIIQREVAVVFLPARGWEHSSYQTPRPKGVDVSPFLELDHDFLLQDLNLSRGFDKVPKQMTGSCHLIPLADLRPQEAIEAAGHQRKLEITIDLHGHDGRQSVHMKKVDPSAIRFSIIIRGHARSMSLTGVRWSWLVINKVVLQCPRS